MKKRVFLTALSLLCVGALSAQETATRDTLGYTVYFGRGDTSYDAASAPDASRLNSFIERAETLHNDSTATIQAIKIEAAASPDESSYIQKSLARKRANWWTDTMRPQGMTSEYPSEIAADGIDWKGLADLVAASDMPGRRSVLAIINAPSESGPASSVSEERKKRLMQLHKGREWEYMNEHFFPQLRRASVELAYTVDTTGHSYAADSTALSAASVLPQDTVQVAVLEDNVSIAEQADGVLLPQQDTVLLAAQAVDSLPEPEIADAGTNVENIEIADGVEIGKAASLAQEVAPVVPDTLYMTVYFERGESSYDALKGPNAKRLELFAERVRELHRDSTSVIYGMHILGGTSPEGNTDVQKELSKKRIEWMADLFRPYGFLSDYPSQTTELGIDWDGLEHLVETSNMPSREQTLDILRNTPEWIVRDGKVVDGRKNQLRLLEYGRVWKYMDKNLFPELRRTRVRLFYTTETHSAVDTLFRKELNYAASMQQEKVVRERDSITLVQRDTVTLTQRDTVFVVQRDTLSAAEPVRRDASASYLLALKTNLLYDVALVPNIGIEFYLGSRWTVGLNWMYGWWKNDRKHQYWRIYGGDFVVRKYFGRRSAERSLTGHHVGIYGQALTYDFSTGGTGYLGGVSKGNIFDKAHWGAGVEYGYSLPIGRRLNLDFTIGVGYLGGENLEYKPMDDHYVWQATHRRQWFGPTKAEISLVWLLWPRPDQEKKGGKR